MLKPDTSKSEPQGQMPKDRDGATKTEGQNRAGQAPPGSATEASPNGDAAKDPDFIGEGDRVRYAIDTAGATGPFSVEVELIYQPIAYRWAQNLKPYDSSESRRFVSYYDSMAPASSEVLARSTARAASSNR